MCPPQSAIMPRKLKKAPAKPKGSDGGGKKKAPGVTDKNLNDAQWRSSVAKQFVAQCFIDEVISRDEDEEMDSKDIFDNLFKGRPGFANFPYNKDIYDDRLKRHRAAINQRADWAAFDEMAFVEDRKKHPERLKDSKGR